MRDDAGNGRAMNVVRRVMAILIDPRGEWPRIARESSDAVFILAQYVAVLALIPALAGFIGAVLVGVTFPVVGTVRSPIFLALLGAIVGYVANFAMVVLLAAIVDGLARRFGGQKNFGNALKLAAYSFTPVWLAGIFLLVPGLRFLTLLGFYSAYLVWTGLPLLMKSPPERTHRYAAVIVVCACVLTLLVATAQQMLFAGPGGI
jgi:hypothetical protein